MALNDLFLLDGVLASLAQERRDLEGIGEVFEVFAFEQILKEFGPSSDEIDFGWVDGQDDGGIDGFYVFINGLLLAARSNALPKEPDIDVFVITSKHADSFRQAPIDSLLATIPEFLNLGLGPSDLKSHYARELLDLRTLFSSTYRDLSARRPRLKIHYVYSSRGDASSVADNIRARSDALVAATKSMFSDIECDFMFSGATELLHLYRSRPPETHKLKLVENVISRGQSNYVVLARLLDYADFLIDDTGAPRRYLFDANVRDFMGTTTVNEDILGTLERQQQPESDFWWLNNGVTIVASLAHVVGKELTMQGVQIVNGLQTSQAIVRYLQELRRLGQHPSDERAILIKVIVTIDPAIRDRVIKATNNQNAVEIASLRATDPVQKNIEDAFFRAGWFYERRKNYYVNEGRPQSKILTPLFVATCVVTLVLRQVGRRKIRSTFMNKDQPYKLVFSDRRDLKIYVRAVELVKMAEHLLLTNRASFPGISAAHVSDVRFMVAYLMVVRRIGRTAYGESELLKIEPESIALPDIAEVWRLVMSVGGNRKKKKRAFLQSVHAGTPLGLAIEREWGVVVPNEPGMNFRFDEKDDRTIKPQRRSRRGDAVPSDIIDLVDAALAPQPWKLGEHKRVAIQLGLAPPTVHAAIESLIIAGRRHQQRAGILYGNDGTPLPPTTKEETDGVRTNKTD